LAGGGDLGGAGEAGDDARHRGMGQRELQGRRRQGHAIEAGNRVMSILEEMEQVNPTDPSDSIDGDEDEEEDD
jgi:hypothetical protein